jgi:hypothetical protein
VIEKNVKMDWRFSIFFHVIERFSADHRYIEVVTAKSRKEKPPDSL